MLSCTLTHLRRLQHTGRYATDLKDTQPFKNCSTTMNDDSDQTIEISSNEDLPKDPEVSVFMLTYNHEKYIAEAIEGVLRQRGKFSIELVIGEDCSTDRTGLIVRDYQKRYPGAIRIVTGNRNVGMLNNATRCRAACRGAYLAYCEGDDRWDDPDKLHMQVAILKSDPHIMLTCHAVRRVDALSGDVVDIKMPARKSRLLTTNEIILGDGDFIPTCSIVVRRSVFENRPTWWTNAPVGDYPLVLRASQLGRVAYQNRVMGTYRINVPASWTTVSESKSDIRYRYMLALEIKKIMRGFNENSGFKYYRSTSFITRRYLYNAIVRSTGDVSHKYETLKLESDSLSYFDLALARIALATGRKLGKVRDFPHRVYMFFSNLLNNLLQPGL